MSLLNVFYFPYTPVCKGETAVALVSAFSGQLAEAAEESPPSALSFDARVRAGVDDV